MNLRTTWLYNWIKMKMKEIANKKFCFKKFISISICESDREDEIHEMHTQHIAADTEWRNGHEVNYNNTKH